MKVLHYEHMGVGVVLTKSLRKLGVDSHVLSSAPHPFGFQEDYLFSQKRYVRKFLRRFEWPPYYGFDVLHNHDNKPLPSYVLNKYHRRLIQHYHDPATMKPLYENVPSFVSLPSIIEAVPDATWIPLPADTSFFSPRRSHVKDTVHIGFGDLHTDKRKLKFIPRDELRRVADEFGNKVCLLPLNRIIKHDCMPFYYQQIDMWIDRFGVDFYGFSAVEAASMGKPVVTQIGEDELSYVPNCPFINTTREGIMDAITELVEDENLRKRLGEKARKFVVDVHDSVKVAEQCLQHYKKLMR